MSDREREIELLERINRRLGSIETFAAVTFAVLAVILGAIIT